MSHDPIVTILVRPENPDNIGAAARAMKNMGFGELRLVNPPRNWRVKGKKMAMSAWDVLQHARPFPSLAKASADLHQLIGTTRRVSEGRGNFLTFSEMISKIRKDSKKFRIGIVFGCESKGLDNEEIGACDGLVTLPTARAYPSLNLAQAVMATLFSIALPCNVRETPSGIRQERFLNKKETASALEHFEKALRTLGYREGGAELLPRILGTMRGIIKRSGLRPPEAQMIKGLSRRICEKVLSTSQD